MIFDLFVLIVGIGLGYGFRGFINRKGKEVIAEAKDQIKF